MADEPLPSDDAEAGFEHAWNWWKYHAEQRINLLRFYILSLGGVGVAVGWLRVQHEALLCFLLSLFGAALAFCFLRLDRRTSDLIKIGEDALRFEEARLSATTGNAQLELCRRADTKDRYPSSYRQIIGAYPKSGRRGLSPGGGLRTPILAADRVKRAPRGDRRFMPRRLLGSTPERRNHYKYPDFGFV